MNRGTHMLVVACLSACSGRTIPESLVFEGYTFYDSLPAGHRADPRVTDSVRRDLPSLGITCCAREEDIGSFLVLHASSWRFWGKIYEKQRSYLYVVDALRTAGLPDLFAAIPYRRSRLDNGTAEDCSAGPWLLPIDTQGLSIEDCHLRGDQTPWSPGDPRPILDAGLCMIDTCIVDERRDLVAATRVALPALRETFEAHGRDVLRTLDAELPHGAAPAVAQHLAAACALERLHPGSFPLVQLDYCEMIYVPTPGEVSAVLARRAAR